MNNTIQLLKKLVSIDSTTGREEKIAGVCTTYLQKKRITVKKIGSNLVTQPKKPSGLAFAAHFDTVPIENQKQLSLIEKNGKLFGRGTSDMKSAIAVYLDKCCEINESGASIVLYSGEEGPLPNGLNKLKHAGFLKGVKKAIVGEPTSLRLETSCRGRILARKAFVGKTGHASKPENAVNAIVKAAESIKALPKLKNESITVTQINTTNASNVVPGNCIAIIDYRFGKEKSIKQAKQNLFEKIGKFESLDECPSFALKTRETAFFEGILGRKASESFFWTDAAQLSKWGIASVNFGPGNVESSHSANEFVRKKSLEDYTKAIEKILSRY